MERISSSPWLGQLLNSSGKQCLQAGHSFICWIVPIAAEPFPGRGWHTEIATGVALNEENKPCARSVRTAQRAYSIERWTSEGYWSLEGPQVSFRAKIIAVNTLASKEVIYLLVHHFK